MRSSAFVVMARTTSAAKRKTATAAPASTSDLDPDDPPDPGDADDAERDGAVEEDLAGRGVEEGRDVAGVHRPDEQADGNGQDRDDDGPDPALGSQGPHLAPQPGPGVHGVGHDVEQLGQVRSE